MRGVELRSIFASGAHAITDATLRSATVKRSPPSHCVRSSYGWWSPGPGKALFRAAESALGSLPLIAEDLGVITPDVRELRDALGLPGMAVLIWAFDDSAANPHRLGNHHVNQVVYTSTHDTDTLAGATGVDDVWPLLELALSSRAAVAIMPVQDVLGLRSEARMNYPGELRATNWRWRLEPGQLTDEHASRLRAAAAASGRVSRAPRPRRS
jgi:4-alpha-glucanotransferase